MLEFLKDLFGTGENGQPGALTFDQLEAAAAKDKKLNVVNLAAGGYVTQAQYDASQTELTGVKGQLAEANKTIKSYKDMDIDGIKQSAQDWENKYNTDTKALQDKLTAQERAHKQEIYFNGVKFTSKAAKTGVIAEFEKQNFELKDGVFVGADSWLAQQKKDDPESFVTEDPDSSKDQGGKGGNQQGAGYRPSFVAPTSKGSGKSGDQLQDFGFHFTGVRPIPDGNNK